MNHRELCKFVYGHTSDMGENYNCLDFTLQAINILGIKTSLEFEKTDVRCIAFLSRRLKKNFKDLMSICEETNSPTDGDIVLMSAHQRMCHVGFWLDNKVVHYDRGHGVMVGSIEKLKARKYFIEGFYRVTR